MSRKQRPIDGFVPRAAQPNQQHIREIQPQRKATLPRKRPPEAITPTQLSQSEFVKANQPSPQAQTEADFELAFDDINVEDSVAPKKRGFFRRKKDAKEHKPGKIKRIIKRSMLAFTAIALLGGAYVGLKAFLVARNIIDRNGNCPVILCDRANAESLNGEGDGRVNIMLVGIGGEGHDAGDLADTIIIASIDPIANEAAMLSVPRDLYVDIPGYESTKINTAHAYGEQFGYENPGYPEGGIGLLQETLEQTLDIPIHYYIRVDFNAFKQAVDEVGGVTVNLDEPLYDSTFWWQYGILDLDEGQHRLAGEEALMYVRSRKTSARGDFARSDRQREVILSLKDEVLSVGTFSDPRKILGLLETAGNNVRTNIQLSEIVRLYEISQAIPSDKIVSTGLSTDEGNYLVGDTIFGASVLVPRAGDYSEVQKFVRSIFTDGFIKSEGARIAVLNGAEYPGLATTVSDELTSFGYLVERIDSAPTSDYANTQIYDLSAGDKTFTKRLLEQRFNTVSLTAEQLPAGISDLEIDFVIILGADRIPNETQSQSQAQSEG